MVFTYYNFNCMKGGKCCLQTTKKIFLNNHSIILRGRGFGVSISTWNFICQVFAAESISPFFHLDSSLFLSHLPVPCIANCCSQTQQPTTLQVWPLRHTRLRLPSGHNPATVRELLRIILSHALSTPPSTLTSILLHLHFENNFYETLQVPYLSAPRISLLLFRWPNFF